MTSRLLACAAILILVLSCYSTYAKYVVEGKFLDQDQAHR